jgi:hypothetical protein
MIKPFTQPDSTTQTAAIYPTSIDAATSVFARFGDNFAPRAQAIPDMTVALDPGHLMNGQTLIEQPSQNTAAVTVPATNPRIDRVVIDNLTGAALVVTGVEAVSPVAPAIPLGKSPLAKMLLTPSTASITDDILTDERDFSNFGKPSGGLLNVQTFTSSGTYTPTPGTTKVIVEVQGGGGSGGSCAATTSSNSSAASGGGAGAYGKSLFTTGFSGVPVTVGAGAAASAAGSNNGNTGGTSSFGALLVAPGGGFGQAGFAVAAPSGRGTGAGSGLPTGANIVGGAGALGEIGLVLSTVVAHAGGGGASNFGAGGNPAGNASGSTGISPGSGGGGASSAASNPARSGGAGASGIVIVYEYA